MNFRALARLTGHGRDGKRPPVSARNISETRRSGRNPLSMASWPRWKGRQAPSSPALAEQLILGALVLCAFGMISFCLDLVRALDPGECDLVEEGCVGFVTHDLRQTQAFYGLTLTLLGHRLPPHPGESLAT